MVNDERKQELQKIARERKLRIASKWQTYAQEVKKMEQFKEDLKQGIRPTYD